MCKSRERHLFCSADGNKKKADGKIKAKRKPCHEGDPSKKSRKVRKTGQSEKGSEEGAAPASIAKESQSDG